MLMLLLAGCGKDSANKESASNETNKPSAPATSQVELTISAAASLKDSMEQLSETYEKSHTDVHLVFNYGASGSLQKQIEQGAPADIFISAGNKQMQALVDQGLIEAKDSSVLLRNELVLIVPKSSSQTPATLDDLKGESTKLIAMGDPDAVPAGNYTKESLESNKLWDTLKPKMVFAKDVRQVLTYVETGNADAGFVYKSDAMISDKVKTAFVVDASAHKPIEYPIGLLKASKEQEAAQSFIKFLESAEALEVFTKFGFSTVS
ncbi:molybdate ABC transporter substrate-binding protein [Paenibacillus sp. CAA11]|nr:molybdate ABC transporter substrate-binding protein [Paenibacillus sp. CAA11]